MEHDVTRIFHSQSATAEPSCYMTTSLLSDELYYFAKSRSSTTESGNYLVKGIKVY